MDPDVNAMHCFLPEVRHDESDMASPRHKWILAVGRTLVDVCARVTVNVAKDLELKVFAKRPQLCVAGVREVNPAAESLRLEVVEVRHVHDSSASAAATSEEECARLALPAPTGA